MLRRSSVCYSNNDYRRVIIAAYKVPSNVHSLKRAESNVLNSAVVAAISGLSEHEPNRSIYWVGYQSSDLFRSSDDIESSPSEGNHNSNIKVVPVQLTERQVRTHFRDFCKGLLWPLFHYYGNTKSFNKEVWKAYCDVNQKFADAVRSVYQPGDIIFIQDYHLMMVPEMLRKTLPDAKIGFFLHTPWPSSELYRALPVRDLILKSLVTSDIIGFQAYSFSRHFMSACTRILGLTANDRGIECDNGHFVTCEVIPVGIDANQCLNSLQKDKVKARIEELKKTYAGKKIIVSRDGTEYINGIPQKLKAFQTFLEKNPDLADKVVLIQLCRPNSDMDRVYGELCETIEKLVGSINGQFGSVADCPLLYFQKNFSFDDICAMFAIADVALITCLRYQQMFARVLHIVLLLAGVCQGKLIPDREITEALNVLVSLDERLDGRAKINYQNMASRKDFTHDNAKEPLFTSVAQRAIDGATYKAFKNLISFYNEPDVDVPETVTSDWEAAIDSFLDAVTNTTVMRSAKEFLTSKGIVSDDESFRNLLYIMWFTQYARGHAVGSSGFESVFSGEVKGNDVIRFNNWFRFYGLETEGHVNYHGWYTREKNIEMSLQFEWNNWKAMDTSMLLNTSPEFEMAVYTICALGKGQCKMNIGRVQVQIFAKTIKQNDIVLIDHCYPGAASPAPSPAPTRRPTEKTRRPRPTEKPEPTGWPTERTRRPRPTERPHGNDFQVLVDKMRAADVDKAGPGDLILHWGKKTQVGLENEQSNSDELFVYVNETLFERPVYATLIEVYKRKLFTPEVCGKEAEMNGFRKAQLQQLFDTWTSTEVFRLAADYLREKEFKYASDMKTLKEYLWNLWFGTYTRCRGPSGSSGWEHVFVGEWKGKTIDGHHDWVGYYLLQKADRVHYRGYYTYVDNLIGTVQYTWDNHVKPKGGFLIGTSPAFDFSLFSVCAILHPGSNGCRYKIDGHPLGVTSFKQSCSAGTCLATAYPTA